MHFVYLHVHKAAAFASDIKNTTVWARWSPSRCARVIGKGVIGHDRLNEAWQEKARAP